MVPNYNGSAFKKVITFQNYRYRCLKLVLYAVKIKSLEPAI